MLWATRRGCHVDRTACVWLIRRFVDPQAAFAFLGDPSEAPQGAELFDVAGARLSHHGDDCSFETFLKEYNLSDPVLAEIAEIVNDADLMDEKYGRPFPSLCPYSPKCLEEEEFSEVRYHLANAPHGVHGDTTLIHNTL